MKTTLALSVSAIVLGVLCAGAIPSLMKASRAAA